MKHKRRGNENGSKSVLASRTNCNYITRPLLAPNGHQNMQYVITAVMQHPVVFVLLISAWRYERNSAARAP